MFDKKEYNKQYGKQYYQDNKEEASERFKQYNKDNPLRHLWDGIKQRCYNPKNKAFKNYGNRGIKVCDLWLNDFKAFKRWCTNNGYQKGLQIDRIDNNGNYCPSNCQFVTQAENVAIGKRRRSTSNKSGYTGVSFHTSGKYQATIYHNKKLIHLGCFTALEEALQARINAEILYFGEQKTNLK